MASSHDRRKLRRAGLLSMPEKKPKPTPLSKVGQPKSHTLELTIEFSVELLLFFLPYGAEQMDLPHNFWLGLASWVLAVGIGVRIFWILPWTRRLPKPWKLVMSTGVVLSLMVAFWSPVRAAYKKRHLEPLAHAGQPQTSVPVSPALPLTPPASEPGASIIIKDSYINDNGGAGILNEDPNLKLDISGTEIKRNKKGGIVNAPKSKPSTKP